MTAMYEKYGDKAVAFAESLVGTCQMGQPDGEYYGIDYDDVAEVLDEMSDIVYECARCGWMCDGGDRYPSLQMDGEDVCEQCYTDEEYENENEDE